MQGSLRRQNNFVDFKHEVGVHAEEGGVVIIEGVAVSMRAVCLKYL